MNDYLIRKIHEELEQSDDRTGVLARKLDRIVELLEELVDAKEKGRRSGKKKVKVGY